MAKDNTNVHVYADQGYGVFYGTAGTSTLPTTISATLTSFNECGLMSDAGITEGHDYNETNIFDLSGALVRVARSQEQRPFTFTAQEDNPFVADLVYPGSTETAGARPVGSGTGRVLRPWVLDLVDGSYHVRYTIPSGEAVKTGTITYNSSAPALYEFTLRPYLSGGVFFTRYRTVAS